MPDFIHPSFDYENAGYQAADLIKMDILLNGRPVEELATIVHRYCFIFHSILYPYIFSGNITCCFGKILFFLTAVCRSQVILITVRELADILQVYIISRL